MQATHKSKVTVNGLTYSGIPSETCNSCHNRGKRIGVSYQEIMKFPCGSPYDAKGANSPSCTPRTTCSSRMTCAIRRGAVRGTRRVGCK